MALFGGSKSTTKLTSEQIGASENAVVIGAGGGYSSVSDDAIVIGAGGGYSTSTSNINEFPDTVAAFAQSALDLAGQAVAQSTAQSQGAISTLGTVAEREKTPLTEWLPFAAVAAVAIIGVAWLMRAK